MLRKPDKDLIVRLPGGGREYDLRTVDFQLQKLLLEELPAWKTSFFPVDFISRPDSHTDVFLRRQADAELSRPAHAADVLDQAGPSILGIRRLSPDNPRIGACEYRRARGVVEMKIVRVNDRPDRLIRQLLKLFPDFHGRCNAV